MKCPKCGQEMVHINNQHICTACGIVANEFSPREQVLRQVKSKMANQAVARQEEYVSPVALATKEDQGTKNSQNTIQDNSREAAPSRTTLDQIIKEMAVNEKSLLENTEKVNSKAEYIVAQEEGERVVPRLERQETMTASVQPQSPQAISVGVSNQNTQINPVPSEPLVTNLQPEAEVQNVEMVYPSHQINPIFTKVGIAAFVVLALFVIGYLVYAYLPGIQGFIDNSLKFMGI